MCGGDFMQNLMGGVLAPTIAGKTGISNVDKTLAAGLVKSDKGDKSEPIAKQVLRGTMLRDAADTLYNPLSTKE